MTIPVIGSHYRDDMESCRHHISLPTCQNGDQHTMCRVVKLRRTYHDIGDYHKEKYSQDSAYYHLGTLLCSLLTHPPFTLASGTSIIFMNL